MVRVRIVPLLVTMAVTAATTDAIGAPADDYFEVGIDYLKKGFFSASRAAFSESLVRAPRQPVPLALLALASAAEDRPGKETAELLRAAHRALPKGRHFRFDLAKLLPGKKALRLLSADLTRRAKKTKGSAHLDALAILGFLQHHDKTKDAPAWEKLKKLSPKDPVLRGWTPKPKKPSKSPAKKKTKPKKDEPKP